MFIEHNWRSVKIKNNKRNVLFLFNKLLYKQREKFNCPSTSTP